MGKPTYQSLRETINQMAERWDGKEPADEWSISPAAHKQALQALERLEADEMPPPLLLPENDGQLSFTWQAGDFKLYQRFGGDDVDYFFLPNKGGTQRSLSDDFPAAGGQAMTRPALRYGNRNVAKMIREIEALRVAIRAEGTPAIQEAWDKVEQHIDYAYQREAQP